MGGSERETMERDGRRDKLPKPEREYQLRGGDWSALTYLLDLPFAVETPGVLWRDGICSGELKTVK